MANHIGLIGFPVKHSLSPFIHQQLHDVPYLLYETLDLEGVLKKDDLMGLNVTAPLKQKAYKLSTIKDVFAQQTGSVNTLLKTPEGLKGFNTDVLALIDLFDEHLHLNENDLIVIIGNGATAQSVKVALKELNFSHIKVVARHPKKGELGFDAWPLNVGAIIQTTPMGMAHEPAHYPFEPADLKTVKFVFDVVYAPLKSPLILWAEAGNIPSQTGLSMLVRQALYGATLLTPQKQELSPLNTVYQSTLSYRQNIVLIGLPYSGKSSFGKRLAQQLNKRFIDVDAMIENTVKMPVGTYILRHGEPAMRMVEKTVIESLKEITGSIIATGGGSVLDTVNVERLKANGCLVFLDSMAPEAFDDSRPLSANKDTYHALKKVRDPLYQKIADITLKNALDIDASMGEWEEHYETYLHHQRP